jgi:hypothetical protein
MKESVLSWYPQSQYAPCPDCGAPVLVDEETLHRCERQRYVEYQMLLLRLQISAFEQQFNDWLRTPQGRFSAYYAARDRHRIAA